MDSKSFRDLFYKALQLHRNEFPVDDNAIEQAVIALQNEYSPKQWKSNPTCPAINYNDPAFRCAYMHKYASCHAALVQGVLLYLFSLNTLMLGDSLLGHEPINICSLGGGPGTDIVGLLSVFGLISEFQKSTFHFTVVDCMIQWKHALASVMQAAQSTQFRFLGSVSSSIYLEADMLSVIPEAVRDAINSADMVTMVKFVSAAASEATPNMIRSVFSWLKPGALVFFIDNAGGGYFEMVLEQALVCGLSMQCGPFQHVRFKDKVFRRKMFGFFSLSCTTITAQMWRKDFPVFWIPYGYSLPLRRCQTRLNGKRHTRPFSLKFDHEHRSDEKVVVNSNDEHSLEIRDQMQKSSESCTTSVDPSAKRKLSWTSSSESSTSKRKLTAKEDDSLSISGEDPSTSKRKLKAIRREALYLSNEKPSSSKYRPSRIEKNSKGKRRTDVLPKPNCSNIQDTCTQSSCLSMQIDPSAAASLQDKESQISSTNSPCEDTSLGEFQISQEKEKQWDLESGLEKTFPPVSLSEDAYIGVTSSQKDEPSTSPSIKLKIECDADESQSEVMKLHDLESYELISCCQAIFPVENSIKKDVGVETHSAGEFCQPSSPTTMTGVKEKVHIIIHDEVVLYVKTRI